MPAEVSERLYKVVINDEEQYSLWPADKSNAPGWQNTGKEGAKDDCLVFVKENWVDMRPKSLREKMKSGGGRPSPATSRANSKTEKKAPARPGVSSNAAPKKKAAKKASKTTTNKTTKKKSKSTAKKTTKKATKKTAKKK